jgi:hypothetical protein
MTTRVVNKENDKYDVYIGRGSPFGNPFSVYIHGREECIAKYRDYFYDRLGWNPVFKRAVEKLRGKTLGCFCKPKACHGDVIVEYLEK